MIKFYRRHFLGVELIFSFVIIGLVSWFLCFSSYRQILMTDFSGIRDVFYGTIVAVSGALLGFVITGLSVLLTTNSTEQMKRLKKSKHFGTIFVIFLSTSKFLGISLILSLISLVFDKDSDPIPFLTLMTIWSMIIVTLRVLRCFWVLDKIINLQIPK